MIKMEWKFQQNVKNWYKYNYLHKTNSNNLFFNIKERSIEKRMIIFNENDI